MADEAEATPIDRSGHPVAAQLLLEHGDHCRDALVRATANAVHRLGEPVRKLQLGKRLLTVLDAQGSHPEHLPPSRRLQLGVCTSFRSISLRRASRDWIRAANDDGTTGRGPPAAAFAD